MTRSPLQPVELPQSYAKLTAHMLIMFTSNHPAVTVYRPNTPISPTCFRLAKIESPPVLNPFCLTEQMYELNVIGSCYLRSVPNRWRLNICLRRQWKAITATSVTTIFCNSFAHADHRVYMAYYSLSLKSRQNLTLLHPTVSTRREVVNDNRTSVSFMPAW